VTSPYDGSVVGTVPVAGTDGGLSRGADPPGRGHHLGEAVDRDILAGVLTAGLAPWRWEMIDRALRTGRPIRQPILGNLVGAVIVLGGLATIVLLLRADAV
jgi:hypothetical protein